MNIVEFVTKAIGKTNLSSVTDKIDCLSFQGSAELVNVISMLRTRLYVSFDPESGSMAIIGDKKFFLEPILNFYSDFNTEFDNGSEITGYCIVEPSSAIGYSVVEDCMKEKIAELFDDDEICAHIRLDYIAITTKDPCIKITSISH